MIARFSLYVLGMDVQYSTSVQCMCTVHVSSCFNLDRREEPMHSDSGLCSALGLCCDSAMLLKVPVSFRRNSFFPSVRQFSCKARGDSGRGVGACVGGGGGVPIHSPWWGAGGAGAGARARARAATTPSSVPLTPRSVPAGERVQECRKRKKSNQQCADRPTNQQTDKPTNRQTCSQNHSHNGVEMTNKAAAMTMACQLESPPIDSQSSATLPRR